MKSTSNLAPSAARHVYSYLRTTDLDVGLVLHFSPEKAAVKRVYSDASRKAPRSVQSIESAKSFKPSS